MSNESHTKKLPDWLMLLIFTICVILLWTLGDTFIAITGTLIMIGIFARGYNQAHLDDH
jgi:hypothetical protein